MKIPMKKLVGPSLIIASLPFFSAPRAFAHGDDTPGPHGGFIRMPGAFHTELVAEGSRTFKIYLLDSAFKNPSVKDSRVVAQLTARGRYVKEVCKPAGDHFACTLPEGQNLEKGKLVVRAVRENAIGNPARYDLPLKFAAKDPAQPQPADPHAGHQH